MRTLWRGLMNSVFWSYERGTWQYDLAVAAIVLFVLLSPYVIQYADKPQVGPPVSSAMVELREFDPATQTQAYRLDARLLAPPRPATELERDLHQALRRNVEALRESNFRIARFEPVRGEDGTVVYYDVYVQP